MTILIQQDILIEIISFVGTYHNISYLRLVSKYFDITMKIFSQSYNQLRYFHEILSFKEHIVYYEELYKNQNNKEVCEKVKKRILNAHSSNYLLGYFGGLSLFDYSNKNVMIELHNYDICIIKYYFEEYLNDSNNAEFIDLNLMSYDRKSTYLSLIFKSKEVYQIIRVFLKKYNIEIESIISKLINDKDFINNLRISLLQIEDKSFFEYIIKDLELTFDYILELAVTHMVGNDYCIDSYITEYIFSHPDIETKLLKYDLTIDIIIEKRYLEKSVYFMKKYLLKEIKIDEDIGPYYYSRCLSRPDCLKYTILRLNSGISPEIVANELSNYILDDLLDDLGEFDGFGNELFNIRYHIQSYEYLRNIYEFTEVQYKNMYYSTTRTIIEKSILEITGFRIKYSHKEYCELLKKPENIKLINNKKEISSNFVLLCRYNKYFKKMANI